MLSILIKKSKRIYRQKISEKIAKTMKITFLFFVLFGYLGAEKTWLELFEGIVFTSYTE